MTEKSEQDAAQQTSPNDDSKQQLGGPPGADATGGINRYSRLLESRPESEAFVRQALHRLETDFREMTLLALNDWMSLGIVAPQLFHSVASLQRPSWGMWNGLISSLKKARNAVLRNAGDDVRKQVESAEFLRAVLALYELRLDDIRQSLQPMSDLCRAPLPKKLRLGAILTMPISLRNRIAHDAPSGKEYWDKAATALEPLIEFHADVSPVRLLLEDVQEYPSPWFEVDGDGTVRAFNGFAQDMSVIYVNPAGESVFVGERTREALNAFQMLLGKTDAREDDFRSLLSKLAPEDIRGVMLGDYLIGRPVGSGGFATVHMGCQLSTGRKVAVKIMHDGQPERMKERFQQEARFLSQLDHPHIVNVYGYGEETWSAPRAFSLSGEEWFDVFSKSAPVKNFIAMEWVEGETLNEHYYAGEGQRDERTWHCKLAEWFSQSAEALAAVHNTGLVHRDIKPCNLMVNDQSEIRLMDFGIARWQDRERTLMTTEGTALGTPAYMSPEQIRSADLEADVGPPTDIYSLCATFYELFAGRRMYDHDTLGLEMVTTRKLSGEAPPRPRLQFKRLPWELETIVMGGLQSDVKDRYESMESLKRDVDHFLHDEPIEYKRPSVWRRMQLGYRRHRAISNVVAAFVFLAIAGTAFYVRGISEALAAEQTAHAERVESVVEALQRATPEGCRVVLRDIRADYAAILPRLRQLLDAPHLSAAEHHRVDLALLQVDAGRCGPSLFQAMLTADPPESVLIRDVLTQGEVTFTEKAWELLVNPDAVSAERLRAAAALAAWSPNDPRWANRKTTDELSAFLVGEDTRSIGTWLTALQPVRDYLIAPLSTIFEDNRLGQGRRLVAAILLSDYTADHPDQLTRLVQVANAEQFNVLYPMLDQRRDKVVPILNALLKERVERDPPIPQEWPDADSQSVALIESAQGMITKRFALAESLTREQLVECTDQLRDSFYRPTRVRAWNFGSEIRYAAIWTRDAREFRVDFFDSADEALAASAEPDFTQVDASVVSIDAGQRHQFVIVRVKFGADDRPTGLEISTNFFSANLSNQGFVSMTEQHAESADGLLSARVYLKPNQIPPNEFSTSWLNPKQFEAFDRREQRQGWAIQELYLNMQDLQYPYGGYWIRRDKVEGQTAAQSDPQARRQSWHELAADGYEPVCIAARCFDNSPVLSLTKWHRSLIDWRGFRLTNYGKVLSATGWHRRLINGDDRDALARRQANAAATLLRLGADDAVWSALQEPDNARLISLLIHRVESMGVSPEVVFNRLQSEQDVNIRRGLVLALGEYAAGPEGSIKLLQGIYQDDDDAGMHSAAEWTLRQWNVEAGDADTLALQKQHGRTLIEKHLLTLEGEPAAPSSTAEKTPDLLRNWFSGPVDHTLVIIPEPVVYNMGAPFTEPGWFADSNFMHMRVIPRGFAIATREVTVNQFNRFANDIEFEGRWGANGQAYQMDAPVVAITYSLAASYCNWLSRMEGLPENQWCYVNSVDPNADVPIVPAPDYLNRAGYRLPTEAEWEYACRANSQSSRYYGDALELLDHYAWYGGNAGGQLQLVGLLKPNDLGLFDMLGNGRELCDLVDRTVQNPSPVSCFTGFEEVNASTMFAVRGGSSSSVKSGVRVTDVENIPAWEEDYRVSFRIARTWQTRESQFQSLSKIMQQVPESMGVYLERARAAAAVSRFDVASQDYTAYMRLWSGDGEGLLMTGGEYITVPQIPFHEFETFTIEVVAQGWKGVLLAQGDYQGAGENVIGIGEQWTGWGQVDGDTATAKFGIDADSSVHHLAIVFDGQSLRAYADGQLRSETLASAPGAPVANRPLMIGRTWQGQQVGSGMIEKLRVSRDVRYKGAAAPMQPFEADENTVLHLDFSQREQSRIPDLSGNGNDGTLRSAWWLPPSASNDEMLMEANGDVLLTIINRTDKPASLFFVNSQNRILYGTVEPGDSFRQESSPGQHWEALIEGREPIKFTAPDKPETEIVLE